MGTKPAILRATYDNGSKRTGELDPNSRVTIIETVDMPDGSTRVRLLRGWAVVGWLTATTKDGVELLQMSEEQAAAAAEEKERKRKAAIEEEKQRLKVRHGRRCPSLRLPLPRPTPLLTTTCPQLPCMMTPARSSTCHHDCLDACRLPSPPSHLPAHILTASTGQGESPVEGATYRVEHRSRVRVDSRHVARVAHHAQGFRPRHVRRTPCVPRCLSA